MSIRDLAIKMRYSNIISVDKYNYQLKEINVNKHFIRLFGL